MKIESGKFVAINYKLTGYDEDPEEVEEIEDTAGREPFSFLFGMGTVLPAFERQFEGRSAGDKFDFELSPAEAYGEVRDELILNIPRSKFLDKNGKFPSNIKEGDVINLQASDGVYEATVEEINDSVVVCDLNHPLAGMTLRFRGEVVEVREPNEEDKKAYMRESCGECHCNGGGDCKGECNGDCNCDKKDKSK